MTLTDPDLAAALEKSPAPRVTLAAIEAKITSETFIAHGVLTLCVLTLENGFKVVGKAAPANPENYRQDIGETYARKDAIAQIWPLEGYLLCEDLHRAGRA